MSKFFESIQDISDCSKSVCESYKYLTGIETDLDSINGEREFAFNELLMLLNCESYTKIPIFESAGKFYSAFNYASVTQNKRLINVLLSFPCEHLPIVDTMRRRGEEEETTKVIMECAISIAVQNLANKYVLDTIHDRLDGDLNVEDRNKLIELRNSILFQSPLLESLEYGISLDEKSKLLVEDPLLAFSMLNVSNEKMANLEDDYFSKLTNKNNEADICSFVISEAYLRFKGLKKPKSEENKKAFVFDPNKKSE